MERRSVRSVITILPRGMLPILTQFVCPFGAIRVMSLSQKEFPAPFQRSLKQLCTVLVFRRSQNVLPTPVQRPVKQSCR